MATKGYCVKCKKKTEMKEPKPVVMKNGSRVLGKPIPKAVEDVEDFASNKI